MSEHEQLQRGVRLFNNGQFFECHEVLEEEWRPERGPRRLFLQSLIHLAVGLYHTQRGNSAGAIRQLRKGLRKLDGYLPSFEGIDAARLHRDALATLGRLEESAETFEYLQIHMTVMRRLWYCDQHEFPLPAGHRFPVTKYRMVRELLGATGLFRFEPAPPADAADVSLAHDAVYVRRFLDGTLDAQAMRRIGFPWSEGLVRRTLASVGGTLRACEDALAMGWGGNLAGGTHHAFHGEGSGFCVFNDIAVAIRRLRRRAAVVDLDVHQGDGTAEFFENDPEVFTLSIHGEKNFPFRKRESKLDIGLADGTSDDEYMKVLGEALPRVFDFKPEVVFYQSGVDALEGDTLGRLKLTLEGLGRRDRLVLTSCLDAGLPLVITLGGGYSSPIERTAEAHAQTFAEAARIFGTASSSPAIAG